MFSIYSDRGWNRSYYRCYIYLDVDPDMGLIMVGIGPTLLYCVNTNYLRKKSFVYLFISKEFVQIKHKFLSFFCKYLANYSSGGVKFLSLMKENFFVPQEFFSRFIRFISGGT